MHNLEVDQTMKKSPRKKRRKSKTQLSKSKVNGKKCENKNIKKKAEMVEKFDDLVTVIGEFEEISRSKKKNFV